MRAFAGSLNLQSVLTSAADLDPSRIITERVYDGKTEVQTEIQYQSVKVVGNGSFGVVFQIRLIDNEKNKDAAIKRVLQDKRFKVISLISCLIVESRTTDHEIDFSS
jgi:hypothetical protein